MEVLRRLTSRDGSVKFLFKLQDNNTIETLYMNDKSDKLTYNSTVCVSSQVGCKVGCKFCATGKQGFVRNLTSFEIVKQVNVCSPLCMQLGTSPIKAVVFAGMGEPLLNYENVKSAINKLNIDYGVNDFELATVGIVPFIQKLTDDFKKGNIVIRLNLSLHASTDEIRNRLIPFNTIYNISAILEAALQYSKAFDCKVRVRYMLIKGLNDTEQDAVRLCRLLEKKPLKLIVSSYNNNCIDGLTPVNQEDIHAFYKQVSGRIDSDVFYNFGNDIGGGCGQLKQLHPKYST